MATDGEKLYGEMHAAFASHDVGKVASLFADDCLYEDLAVGVAKRGKKEVADFVRGLFDGFPDVKFESRGVFSSRNRLCFEWNMTGTHTGNLPGMPATGRTISVRGVSVEELKDGKVARHTDYYDMATFLRQLGVLPPMPQGQ